MATRTKPFTSLRGCYAQIKLRNHIVKEWNRHADLGHTRPSGEPFHRIGDLKHLPQKHEDTRAPRVQLPPSPVCIIGAGVSGLYLGYLLKLHNEQFPAERIDFDILEASGRTGGRCHTVHFPPDPNTPHNYFDAGAMRIPHLESMAFVLALMEQLGLDIQPYGYTAQNAPEMYFNTFNYNTEDVTEAFDAVMKPFVEQIEEALASGDNWNQAIDELMASTEPWSTRAYLAQDQGWTQSDINMAEMVNTSTGNFDQSLTETVIDYYDFNNASTIDWSRVNGGMSLFTDALAAQVSSSIRLNTRVTDVTYNAGADPTGRMRVTTMAGAILPYASVFCTTSLPCLQQINPFGPIQTPSLGIGLSQDQQLAIRSLHYDLSVKVAMKFRYPWWSQDCNIGAPPTWGGSGSTDLPIRTVVYPSWNDVGAAGVVLLASYTWSQDSTRIGALSKDPVVLRKQVIEDLARLHNPLNPGITPQHLDSLLIGDPITYDWNQDPYMGGAFALFGPSQFSTLYPGLTVPAADGRFFICGEHASAHHAWIAGSMTSVLQALGIYANTHGLPKVVQWLQTLEVGKGEKKARLLDKIDEIELGDTGTSHLLAELGRTGFKHEKNPKEPKERVGKQIPFK